MISLTSTGWDLTRAGILLYLAGLLASLIYYSQFGIFSIEFLRPQCILIGIFMLFIYALFPTIALVLFNSLRKKHLQLILALSTLILSNFTAFYLHSHRLLTSLLAVATAFIAQALLFSSGFSKGSLSINPSAVSMRLVILLPMFALHYASFIHPLVPGSFGGGRPVIVDVYADPQDLPYSRFVRSRNRNRANKHRDSYRLQLLYETTQDYYFVEERRSQLAFEGYVVTRLQKSKILRMDYTTPSWVSMKGID